MVCVRRKGMKEAWCLATSFEEGTAQEVMDVYGRHFATEETIRDVKDLKFGMGLKQVRVGTPERRDKLLLISAFAQALLTLLGAAGESLGYDKYLKVNTAKKRTHSHFTQGAYCFMAIRTRSPSIRTQRPRRGAPRVGAGCSLPVSHRISRLCAAVKSTFPGSDCCTRNQLYETHPTSVSVVLFLALGLHQRAGS
ncbi:transposase [Corallococcus macrosporus DSM 14697]|uniref:Transposase n=1 Tax=Corallococcus macrosporus DSM 14697 TaxID=1189310 RepID=A0A250JMR2_9BACT|nr:transposase [Corallococcus macrosporus DSM 14697]